MHQRHSKFQKFPGGTCPRTPLVPRGLRTLASSEPPTFVFEPPTSKLVKTPADKVILLVYCCTVYASLVMITGKVIFGFILGNIASTLANAEIGRVNYEEKLGTVQVCSIVTLWVQESTYYIDRHTLQARRQVGCVGCASTPPPGAKRSTWWDCKIFKVIQNNVMMAGLTDSMHFKQFEDLKFQNFYREACPRNPLKPLCLWNLHGLSFQH